MCQDEQTPETSTTPVSEENEQQKQAQKPEKKKQKPQKQDKPPTPPLRPLHEALIAESSKIANGARYVDTHCHTLSTLASYQQKAKPSDPQIHDLKGFLQELFPPECASIMDVYCEPPFRGWKEVADNTELPVNYYFAIGCHPHDAKDYNDQVEQIILDAMKHEKCKAWGEMGLDYHYNLSPPDVQKRVLIRQLEKAVSLGRNIVIHTREADDDIFEILTKYVPKETHIHIHCFTDTPALAASLLSHFPNLYIGVTGVITYSSNVNTAEAVKAAPLERLLLETDSPFMTPNNAQKAVKELTGKSSRIPVCWSALIPWTAEWVANIKEVSVEKVLEVTTENAKRMYGITV